MNGAVAPVVANHFVNQDVEVVTFDRAQVDINDELSIRKFLEENNPDYFLHIATGPATWAETNAKLCRELEIRFLFTSTVSVFSEQGSGPYTIDSVPNAEDDYGRYKRECEELVRLANPISIIARLGWQIGNSAGSNNMFDYLERTMQEKGQIEASELWFPSCSFMEDTAETLFELITNCLGGTYLLNSNLNYNFYEIVNALNQATYRWKVIPTNNLDRDDRMFDDRVKIKNLSDTLKL